MCVTLKENVQESVLFANSDGNVCEPYGALFVFEAKENEYPCIKQSGGMGMTNSIHFKEEPERLFSIITTNENVERLRKVALECGIDENKIMNHKDFIEMCVKKYGGHNK